MSPMVYLAGPIAGLNYDGATSWREETRVELAKFGIKAFSPLRAQEHLREVGVFSDTAQETARLQYPMSTPRGLTTRDRFDAMRCDVMLVNLLGAKKVSIGTVLEFGWANAKNTPIVVAIEDGGNPHEHAMLNEVTGFRVNCIWKAIRVTRSILLP